MDRRDHRIETFDPLLRDLVAWGLVERIDTGKPFPWKLTEAAQSRLNEIIRGGGPLPVDELVYVDHFCADCHFRVRTRIYEGLYLCDSRKEKRLAEGSQAETTSRRRSWRHNRHPKKGTPPLAG